MAIGSAVVLAAGEGNRLRPLTRSRPKPMLPAATRPILEYVLDTLVDAGVDEICLVVGYRRERVQEHFGPTYRDIELTYVRQDTQLGSGHALLAARNAVDGPVLVLNGDRIIEAEAVTAVAEAFETHGEPTVAVTRHPAAHRYGAVSLDGDHLTELVEKPARAQYRLINAGVYAFDDSIFGSIDRTPRHEGELALTDTIVRLIDAGEPVRGVSIGGMWVDATYPWDLLTVTEELLARGRVTEPARAERVWVSDSARVHGDATLQPPVVIAGDCEVGPGAVVGPQTALGRNATVGSNVTIARSVLDADTRVGPGSTLVDCVTGQDCRLGAATVVSGGPADVRVEDRVFEDQRLGAVVADHVRAVGDVSLAPGTLVGPASHLGFGVRASGEIPEGAEVVR